MCRTILKNGKIYTLDSNHPIVDAVTIENGTIMDVGRSDEMLLQYGRPGTSVIDLEGKTASPGLTDSHMHLSGVGLQLLNLDLTGTVSKDSLLKQIKKKAETLSADEWLTGRGWDETVFTDGFIPTIEELDQVAACPLFLTRSCGHAFLVNSRALQVCGYYPGMVVPSGGKIELNPSTQKPTGLIHETAADFIKRKIPPPSYSELKDCMRQGFKQVLSQGLTSIHTEDLRYLGGFDQTYQLFDELVNAEQLGVRCNLLIYHPYIKALKERNLHTGDRNGHVTIGAAKIFLDGALGGRTALLSQAYSDDPSNYGNAVHDEAELEEIIREARSLQMPIAVHAIGDRAVERVLQGLEKFSPVAYRDRLLHAQVLRPDLLPRLKNPNLAVDIQPIFVLDDYPWVEERLGNERLNHSYIWKTMMESGIICAGGSDAPVEPLDPLLGIYAAVMRRKAGNGHRVFHKREKLSILEAARLFTMGGAYASTEEHLKGTISRGKVADFTVYSKNIFEIEPDELLSAKIEKTIIGGQILFERT